ncbi:MAG TPA: polyphosphate kinase 1, partial [Longimicrobiales bacterium]|nr:polyphosphate kinase 1 [Longimicrobiales bacterium]
LGVVMFLDDVIRYNLPSLFPRWEVGGAYAVKLTRDAELHIEGEFSENLVASIRKALAKREAGVPSRFLYDMQASYALVSFLKGLLGLEDEDLVVGGRYHNLHDLADFPRFGKDELSFEPWPPFRHPDLDGRAPVFASLQAKDRLLHFPYHSYEPVVRFLTEAAADPDVEEIWLTVYRVSSDSKVLAALLDAADRGKKVRVFVEVMARFDEESNLRWAERLEKAGILTIYSIPGLKVHAKLALAVRREGGDRRRYAYLGTGNFNEHTARFYTDWGLLTADPRLTTDVESVFGYLAGELEEPVFRHCLVAPFNLRSGFYHLVDREIEAARAERESGIIAKMNSLEDRGMIERLYEASRAGVPMRMVVRGICCLLPGVPGFSESIHVRSIVDRYLEHGRAFLFHAGGEERMYLASADWMRRNLSHRVEMAFPLHDPDVRAQVRRFLDLQLADNLKARVIDRGQSNTYVSRSENEVPLRAQSAIREMVRDLARDVREPVHGAST